MDWKSYFTKDLPSLLRPEQVGAVSQPTTNQASYDWDKHNGVHNYRPFIQNRIVETLSGTSSEWTTVAPERAPNLETKFFTQAGSEVEYMDQGISNPGLQILHQSGLGRTKRSPHAVYSPASVLSSCTTMPTTVPSPGFSYSNAGINLPYNGYIGATSASCSPHLAGFPTSPMLSAHTAPPASVRSHGLRNSNAGINPPYNGYIGATSASCSPHLAGFPTSPMLSAHTAPPASVRSHGFRNSNAGINPPYNGYIGATSASCSPHLAGFPTSPMLSAHTDPPTSVLSHGFRNSHAGINPPSDGYIWATSASTSPHLAGFPAKAEDFLASPTLSSNPEARKVCIPARLGITGPEARKVCVPARLGITEPEARKVCVSARLGITEAANDKVLSPEGISISNTQIAAFDGGQFFSPVNHSYNICGSSDHQVRQDELDLVQLQGCVKRNQNAQFLFPSRSRESLSNCSPGFRIPRRSDLEGSLESVCGITQLVPKKPNDHQPLRVQNLAMVDFPASNRLKRYREVSDSNHEFFRHVDQGVSLEREALLDKFQTGSGGLEDIVLHHLKRSKKDNLLSPLNESESPRSLAPLENQPSSSSQLSPLQQQPQSCVSIHSEVMQVDMDSFTDFETRFESLTNSSEIIVNHQPEENNPTDTSNTGEDVKVFSDNIECESMDAFPKVKLFSDNIERESMDAFPNEMDVGCKDDQVQMRTDFKDEQEIKSKTSKMISISMADFFTKEQIKEHIMSFGQSVDQSTLKDKRNREEICQLCGLDKICLASEPIYCSCCFVRIKQNASYYCTTDQDATHFLCASCHKNGFKAGKLCLNNMCFYKEKLSRMKNDKEHYESWVRCDKCLGWQHQICALFNDKIEHKDKLYTCPKCLLKELENGDCPPLPDNVAFRSKDLPETMLSSHIESRLFKRLKEEREERAKVAGKHFDEVPGAQDLVVRVVSSVDKNVEVKKKFLEYLGDESYPAEFSYTSKAILLFQKIEGVDICLFCVYVQEFGSECSHPNQRCVYISYLDSVKLFRPDIVAVTGEPLRRIVYHEILIGYLDYVKRRGFANCYLWVCPPLKGDEYIFSCHPENQKTLKTEKLRQWYLSMLKKAGSENIVVSHSNLHDKFFLQNGESNCKITAARLPHFDGDYWYVNCEQIIKKLEEENGKGCQKITKKPMSMRTLKAMGHTSPSDGVKKDVLLIQKLKELISPRKEDFVVVHLQFVCKRCQNMVLSGNRWFCNQCKNFHLCERCHGNQALHLRGTHIAVNGEQHVLSQVRVDVPLDTTEKDLILDNGLFETRQTFLEFCYKNHYQFDTLRRAKHSSMITLHHLQNHTVVRNAMNCNVCHKNADFVHSWSCETCPEFNVCAACYQEKDGSDHIHKLTQRSSRIICGTNNKEARQRPSTVVQTDVLLNVLKHACKCPSTKDDPCFFPYCRKLRRLFQHASTCTVRVSGHCINCKKTWFILNLHSKSCTDPDCEVPRCRDLNENEKLKASQNESCIG